MANIANDIGMGLMGFSNAFFPAMRYRDDLDMRRQLLARQDDDAQLRRQLLDLQAEKLRYEMDQQKQAMGMLAPLLQGGLMGGAFTPDQPSAALPTAGPSASGGAPIWQRNNNPGNLRVPGKMDFQAFPTMEDGTQAMLDQLGRYSQRGLNTIGKVVNTYAPAGDGANNPSAYIASVSRATGLDPNQPLDWNDPMTRFGLTKAMMDVEGSGKAVDPYMVASKAGLQGLPDGWFQRPQAQGTQYAANGGVASDMPRGGGAQLAPAPPSPGSGINPDAYARIALMAKMPGAAGQVGQALLAQADARMKASEHLTPQQKSDMAFEDAKRLKTWEADLKAKDKAAERTQPGFQGTGMDQQAMNAIQFIGPKIQDGSATDEEKRQYTLAEMHLSTPKVQTDPQTGAQTVIQTDITQFGFPSMRPKPQQQPATQTGQAQAPPGYTMTQTSGPKAMAAGDAGKVKGAELSQQYLDDASRLLFPGGQYDRMAVVKSMLPGTAEADARNKMREAIGYALYLKTGAAATPKEISEQESLYVPGVTDDEKVAKSKMERLRSFLGSVVQAVRPGDAAQKQAQPPAENDPLGVR